ncbi:EscU/YscU/HrcU family type III secretion system export apparatus switch protein [Exiguobacterium sp. AM39-5BH]|uniref:EscU/YscU/HrcU family type III secretion system export apparatus switch protein n=1 Tax=Exiguobacterium sp. AM39-5BH TaxID=2292355 RepID=UPI000FE19EAD|nr:EscU/YscU/HrcU family type III secretion system export apparatus switch protein [Exiguobacterium sp. AM39-5BH]RHB51149.1 flagellar biosynthesis protein FlhB [Exiguobacterium sp. AM39-5BH]
MTDRKQAIALSYEQSMESPRVVAKGGGLVAERMLALAQANGVPIHEDPALLSLLSALKIEEQIPEDLYQVIAELFVFLYQMEQGKIGDV